MQPIKEQLARNVVPAFLNRTGARAMRGREMKLGLLVSALVLTCLSGTRATAGYITITLEAVPAEAADMSPGCRQDASPVRSAWFRLGYESRRPVDFEAASLQGGASPVNSLPGAPPHAALFGTDDLAGLTAVWRFLAPELFQHPLWIPSSIFRPPRIG